MTDAVFISNENGEFVEFNDAFATFHRFPDKEACSKKFAEYPDILNVYMPNGEPAPVDMWAVPRALRGEVKSNEEYIIQRKDTGEKWVGSYSFSPIKDKKGAIIGSVVVGRDITSQKKVDQEIRELNEKLEQRVDERTVQLKAANKELEAFSYSVSHDLRAPLRGINGFTQLLVDGYSQKLDEEGRRFCSVIQYNSKRMGILIDDLLAFSRLSRTEMRKTHVDMKGLANSAFEELTNFEHSENINITVEDICDAMGDPTMLKQVWVNLLSNAIKYSSKKEKTEIRISSLEKNNYCCYCVKDNGVGFDMAFNDKLFGVFQRLHSTSEFEGTGVGLAIVQRIIFRHGGEVWAKGEVGKGAEFNFSLPINIDGSF
jgi:PAS domain S-box-containing protein